MWNDVKGYNIIRQDIIKFNTVQWHVMWLDTLQSCVIKCDWIGCEMIQDDWIQHNVIRYDVLPYHGEYVNFIDPIFLWCTVTVMCLSTEETRWSESVVFELALNKTQWNFFNRKLKTSAALQPLTYSKHKLLKLFFEEWSFLKYYSISHHKNWQQVFLTFLLKKTVLRLFNYLVCYLKALISSDCMTLFSFWYHQSIWY